MNDADIEMAALQESANHESRLRKKGICAHGWRQIHEDNTVTCKDCGKRFSSWEECEEDREEVLA